MSASDASRARPEGKTGPEYLARNRKDFSGFDHSRQLLAWLIGEGNRGTLNA